MKKNGELSLEQLRQKLHISKRKAAWMLQNGVITCRIVNAPTHLRYYVSEEDSRSYMKQSITESKKKFVRGQFSSRNKDAPEANEASGAEISVFAYLSRKDRNKFERILEKRLAIYPDAMDINRVAKIIGYSRTTILRRAQNGDIFAVMMNDEYVLSKAGVIEFFASDKAFRIYDKSKWHENAVKYLWKILR